MIKASIKLTLLIVWIALWYAPVWLAHRANKLAWRDRMSVLCNRGLLAICEIRLRVHGAPSAQRPLLMVANHLSYLDIPILASQLAVSFTPKLEIAGWPVIGPICRMTGCVFVERRTDKISAAKNALTDALASGRVVCLYPEGTTGSGLEVLPFKSSLLSIAEEQKSLSVQPVAVSYHTICRLPIGRSQWPHIAWYGDMELAPHLWEFLKLGPVEAEIAFLPPLTMANTGDRKALAAACHAAITGHIEKLRYIGA